jgi:hypothetical protein
MNPRDTCGHSLVRKFPWLVFNVSDGLSCLSRVVCRTPSKVSASITQDECIYTPMKPMNKVTFCLRPKTDHQTPAPKYDMYKITCSCGKVSRNTRRGHKPSAVAEHLAETKHAIQFDKTQ